LRLYPDDLGTGDPGKTTLNSLNIAYQLATKQEKPTTPQNHTPKNPPHL
jgi:hypothetical protein